MKPSLNYWTDSEIDILVRCYPRMWARSVKELLPGRTLAAIYFKARSIGLTAHDRTGLDRELRLRAGHTSLSRIARSMGCCPSLARYRARKLGLI